MALFSRTWPGSGFTASSVVIALIRVYQQSISPVLPRSCIYSPSCSSFAIEAYRRYGLWRGTWHTVRRLLRCGPWGAGGEDPVR